MGKFFSKNRNDGYFVEDNESIQFLQPYIMRGRNESVVYYKHTLEVDEIEKYIQQKRREGTRITVFNILVTALLNIVYQRPMLNNFIIGRRAYRHKDISVSYVVKRNLTDQAGESIATVHLNENDNLFTVTDRMNEHIRQIQNREVEKTDDKFMNRLRKFPRWLLRLFASLLFFFDFHGWLPADISESVPLYSSIFLSHLGSLGASAPIHHLYEFGTNSIFVTIGRIYDLPKKAEDGGVNWVKAMDLWFSVDERICDGFYLIRSIRMLDRMLQDPAGLEISPSDSAVKKRLKEKEREERKACRALKLKQEYIEMYGDEDGYDNDSELSDEAEKTGADTLVDKEDERS